MRYVIIGASAAGITAARKIREIKRESEIVVLSKEDIKPYSKMALPYLLAGELSREGAFLELPEGIKLMLNTEAKALNTKEKLVETEEGEKFTYDKLLIATGAQAYIPEVPGSGLTGVFSLRNLEDIQRIKRSIQQFKQKRVILSGAGLINAQIGDALSKIGIPVTYIVGSQRILSTVIDGEGAEIMENAFQERGVQILKGEQIKGIERKNEFLYATLNSGKVVKGVCIIFGKGVLPCVDFLKKTGIKINKGVAVNQRLETNINDVYAAGDVAEVKDIIHKDTRTHPLWPVAVEQGRIAGSNMAGIPLEYRGDVARNALTVFGKTVLTGGISTTNQFNVYKRHLNGDYRKIVINEGKLVGFIFIGKVQNPGVYLYIMKEQIEIERYINLLLDGSISYSALYPGVARVFF